MWHDTHQPRKSRISPGYVYCLLCTNVLAIGKQSTVVGRETCPVGRRLNQ